MKTDTAGASTGRHDQELADTVIPTCAADPGRYVLFNPSGMPEHVDVFWVVDLFEDRYVGFYACSWDSLKEDVEFANRKNRPLKDPGYMWNTLTPDELDDHDEEGWLREQFKFGLLKCERQSLPSVGQGDKSKQ